MVEKAIDWLDLHNPGRAIVYACGQEHGEALLAYLGDRRKSALLTSKTETSERRQIETKLPGRHARHADQYLDSHGRRGRAGNGLCGSDTAHQVARAVPADGGARAAPQRQARPDSRLLWQ